MGLWLRAPDSPIRVSPMRSPKKNPDGQAASKWRILNMLVPRSFQDIAQLVQTIVIVFGILFALSELRLARYQHSEQSFNNSFKLIEIIRSQQIQDEITAYASYFIKHIKTDKADIDMTDLVSLPAPQTWLNTYRYINYCITNDICDEQLLWQFLCPELWGIEARELLLTVDGSSNEFLDMMFAPINEFQRSCPDELRLNPLTLDDSKFLPSTGDSAQ
jgi:hypothetical protein